MQWGGRKQRIAGWRNGVAGSTCRESSCECAAAGALECQEKVQIPRNTAGPWSRRLRLLVSSFGCATQTQRESRCTQTFAASWVVRAGRKGFRQPLADRDWDSNWRRRMEIELECGWTRKLAVSQGSLGGPNKERATYKLSRCRMPGCSRSNDQRARMAGGSGYRRPERPLQVAGFVQCAPRRALLQAFAETWALQAKSKKR